MKFIFAFCILLFTSCNFLKKPQEHFYNVSIVDYQGNPVFSGFKFYGLTVREEEYIVLVNSIGDQDTLFIDKDDNLTGDLHSYWIMQDHIFQFKGKIIDESWKSLHIKGDYYYTANGQTTYRGTWEIY